MKRLILALTALLLLTSAVIPAYESYIKKYADTAVREMHRSGVPASITLAQGLLESNAGQSTLAVNANNHFGIKCHNDWKGKRYLHDDDARNECFRVYANADQSFTDHSDFLRFQDRYKGLFELKTTDYKGWARGLKKAGYATDPAYAEKLIRIIEEYGLYRYDTGVDIPETPLELEKAVEITSDFKEEYRFPLNRSVFQRNGVPFVIATAGDSYASIAKANNLFLREILSFNDAPSGAVLVPGETVYLHAKKNKAARGVDKYVVGDEGESLRDISQKFAVKLSAIVKLNHLPRNHVPQEGDTILLR